MASPASSHTAPINADRPFVHRAETCTTPPTASGVAASAAARTPPGSTIHPAHSGTSTPVTVATRPSATYGCSRRPSHDAAIAAAAPTAATTRTSGSDRSIDVARSWRAITTAEADATTIAPGAANEAAMDRPLRRTDCPPGSSATSLV